MTTRLSNWLLALFMGAVLTTASFGPANAAGAASVASGQLSDKQIEEAIPLLTDKEVRQLLISRLKNSEGSLSVRTPEQ